MGLKGMGWIGGLAAGLCAVSPAYAREADLHPGGPLLRAAYSPPAARRAAVKSQALAMLGTTDRGGLQAAKAHGIEQSFGPFDLAIEASRLRGGRSAIDAPATAGDRYATSALVVNTGFDLGDGFHAGPSAGLMHMMRHFSVVAVSLKKHTTDIASVGLRLWQDAGPALSLDYVATSTRKVRPLDRMAEIVGGAPRAGRGLRLGITGGARHPQAGGLTWGLNLSALRRPRSEYSLGDTAGTIADRRVEFSIVRAF